jgi:PhnB protein
MNPPNSNYPAFSPYLTVRNAEQAIEFYKAAFDATERIRLTNPADGTINHAELLIHGNLIMISEESPQWGTKSPLALSGTPVAFCLIVPNADIAFDRAIAAGATVHMPLSDHFYGFRSGSVLDPSGHQWMLQHEIEKLSPSELQSRWNTMMAGCGTSESP